MIMLATLFLAADPAPLSTDPFMDEQAAAHDFEGHLNCLAGQAFARRNDPRAVKEIAADAVRACHSESDKLRASLADVYRRKPDLLPAGKTPDQAAEAYVTTMNNGIEALIQEGRNHK